jgi:hypothetical protein
LHAADSVQPGMFGTYAAETEKVEYGLVEQLEAGLKASQASVQQFSQTVFIPDIYGLKLDKEYDDH